VGIRKGGNKLVVSNVESAKYPTIEFDTDPTQVCCQKLPGTRASVTKLDSALQRQQPATVCPCVDANKAVNYSSVCAHACMLVTTCSITPQTSNVLVQVLFINTRFPCLNCRR
jgi:hypothetical protein